MPTNPQGERETYSLTADKKQRETAAARMAEHNLTRNEYFWALVEADQSIPLKVVYDETAKKTVLRPALPPAGAEDPKGYSPSPAPQGIQDPPLNPKSRRNRKSA